MALERKRRIAILVCWAVLICCVTVGSLLSAASRVMVAISLLKINDKVIHGGAYLALAALPVTGFRSARHGTVAGLAMFLLGLILEFGQFFAPGRSVELGDVIANGIGVGCGMSAARWARKLANIVIA